jgi:LysM repeat protein
MASKYNITYGAEAYLQFVGKPLILSMEISNDSQIFKVELEDFSLNDLITGIVQIVKPGFDLKIPVPWSYILDFEIPKFELLLKVPKDGGKTEFGISFNPGFDDFGLKINEIEVFARSIREVNVNMKGALSIFGIDYDLNKLFGDDGVNLLGAEGLPTPAPKPTLFDLKFMGIGQHLELKNAAQYNHVQEVVDAMVRLFDVPAPGTVVPPFSEVLKFNNDSQWLFGLDIEIMKTVALKIVFNDPVLYGLYISLSGEKAKALAGLEFEILYKKITDDIGVYQIELKLPDAIRNMEFGAVSVTLPVIGIWIYTNGNFKVDLGFPYNNDFSRSFAIQSLPFIGQGGFYFSYLNGATSDTVPKTDLGTFDPVLEFGIGMNLGLGKTFNKGILSAGLTLTFYGILEGTLAWFKPYDNAPVNTSLPDFFYRVKGTFGIIGHIFGSVNFAIISATLDIVIYAQATVLIEAGEPIYLAFEAGVSLKLTVKINLGLFKVKIHLSFSATVRESFTLGSASATQWNTPAKVAAAAEDGSLAAPVPLTDDVTQVYIPMNWGQKFEQSSVQEITVDLIPLFSADKTTDTQVAVGVSALFMENNRGEDQSNLKGFIIDKNALEANSDFQPFGRLCISVLGWILNSTYSPGEAATTFEALLSKKITNVTIANILYTLDNSENKDNPNTDNGSVPFTYTQATDFLKALFNLNIVDPNTEHKKDLAENPELKISDEDKKSLFVTIFPMIPQLFMSNSANSDVIDFDTENSVNKSYLQEVMKLVKRFTSTDTESGNDNDAIDISDLESMATLIFRDYFLLIGKSLLQTASDVMEVYNYTLPSDTITLAEIADNFATTPAALLDTNKAQDGLLAANNPIVISGSSYSFGQDETFTALEGLKNYTTTATAWASAFIALNKRIKMFVPMSEIILPNTDKKYRVLADDTFESIAAAKKLSEAETAEIITLNSDDAKILAALTAVILPPFEEKITADATFLSITTEYGIDLNDIADANAANDKLFNKDAIMMVQYVSQLSIEELMNAVYQDDFFMGAGGSASRFALHGVRLPNVIVDGDPGDSLEGLYELSGQQFSLPKIEDPTTYSYTFTLSKTKTEATEDPLPWVLFNGETFIGTGDDKKLATLPYTLLDDEVKLVEQFQKLSFDPTLISGPSNLKLYQDQTKTFAFSNPIIWEKAGVTPTPAIWNFSKALTAITAKNPDVILNTAVQAKPNEGRTISPLDLSDYYYSTLVPLTIRKIGNGSEEGINKKTFEVFGTDATGIDLLTAMLKDSHFENLFKDLTILYSSDPSNDEARSLRSISSDDLLLLLINTNLSTETNPENVTLSEEDKSITNTPITTFIERIWKSSLVRTGGYFLYYAADDDTTLPDNLFSENGDAEIYLLISYDQPIAPATQTTLQPYLNSVVTKELIDTSQELLFGEWQVDLENSDHDQLLVDGKIERNAIIKPGNVGFELSRENPNKKFGDPSGVVTEPNYPYDLEQQYNLLNFKTLADAPFEALESVIPIGPTDNDSSTANDVTDDTDDIAPWNYSKAMPVFNFYTQPAAPAEDDSVPPAASSPYIGLKETLEIAFNWQDNYGNVYDKDMTPLSYTILYFDELIALSAWPALTTEYWLQKPATGSKNFNLSLTFNPGDKYSWNPNGEHVAEMKAAILTQANSDLLKYTSVYYQFVQKDLSITFDASVEPGTSFPKSSDEETVLKNGVVDYLTTVMAWISKFIKNPDENNQYIDPENPTATTRYLYNYIYTCEVKATNTLDIFPLSVNVFLTREEASIDPQFIIQESPKLYVENVQQTSSIAKPKSTGLTPPPSNTTDSADSPLLALTNFAYHFEEAFDDQELKTTATYVRGQDSSLTTENEQELWVVRFKEFNSKEVGIGFNIKFDEALYYAPQPLANFLISLQDIEIFPYAHYTLGGETTSSVIKTFNGIDPETWGMALLKTLELTFDPAMSLPITMVDHLNGSTEEQGILASLLKAKETLAEAISYQTIPILQDPNMQDAGWAVAQEKLRQQLLINLVDGYAVNAVIQYNTGIESPYPDTAQPIAPNLFGKPFIELPSESDAEKNYSFSTGKVPIRDLDNSGDDEQSSYLTYTFTTQNPTVESNLPLPINYQINHMEFDITTLGNTPDANDPSDLEKFDLSKWLTFIIPLNAQDTESEISHIPIPIRQYPILPAFGSQLFQSNSTNTSAALTIEEAKLSSFSFDYTLDGFVAQDAYNFEVYFNAKKKDWEILETTKKLTEKQTKLFSALAQFTSVNNEFITNFREDLPKVNADISKEDLDKITKILSSYEELATTAADAWLDLFKPDLEAAAEPSVDVVKVVFDVNERGSTPSADPKDPENLFEVVVRNWSATVEGSDIDYVNFPVIDLPGYTAEAYVCDTVNCTDPILLPPGGNLAKYAQVIFRYYTKSEGIKVYLTLEEGIAIENRRVTFVDMSVLLIQNGWAGFYVERNAEISGVVPPLKTSPEFIYTTPVRRFNTPITPSVTITDPIPIAPIEAPADNLLDYLKKLFSDLMITPEGKITPVTLKILVNYEFSPVAEKIKLPVLLIPPTVFSEDDVAGTGDGITALNSGILDWFKSQTPVQNMGSLIFSITFYSSIDEDNTLPLLSIQDLTLAVEDVADIKAYAPE